MSSISLSLLLFSHSPSMAGQEEGRNRQRRGLIRLPRGLSRVVGVRRGQGACAMHALRMHSARMRRFAYNRRIRSRVLFALFLVRCARSPYAPRVATPSPPQPSLSIPFSLTPFYSSPLFLSSRGDTTSTRAYRSRRRSDVCANPFGSFPTRSVLSKRRVAKKPTMDAC